MKHTLAIPFLLALCGCGGDPESQKPPSPTGEVRLGMTPDQVAAAAGTPDRTINTSGTHGFEIRWTYKKSRHLVLKGAPGADQSFPRTFRKGEPGADQDFPRGCQLVFGAGGRTLTSVLPLGVP